MRSIRIPCPKCKALLHLKDRKLLGRKRRCPKCQFKFILEESDEVELELTEPEEPVIGTAAKWVLDSNTSRQPAVLGNGSEQAHSIKTSTIPEPPTFASLAKTATSTEPTENPFENLQLDPNSSVPESVDTGTHLETSIETSLRWTRRRSSQQTQMAIVIGSLLAVGLFVAIYYMLPKVYSRQRLNPNRRPNNHLPVVNKDWEQEKQADLQNAKLADTTSPTKGQPLELLYIPAGARALINLHPAELYGNNPRSNELRACMGPLAEWIEDQITGLCLFKPQEIEEVLICLLLGARGTEPDVTAVVKLVEKQKPTTFLGKFKGQRTDDFGYPVYLNEKHAYILKDDQQTFALAPKALANELADSRVVPGITSTGVESILPLTDRDRHVTVVFEPLDLKNHQDVLVADNVKPMLTQIANWFGDDIETVVWSMHWENEMYSELLLRNQYATSPARLQQSIKQRVAELPTSIFEMVHIMQPQQVGKRNVIGRFPAMVKVSSQASLVGIGERYVQVVTKLPERAGPNLALATLLTWDESTRTDFSKEPAKLTKNPMKLPARIAERLKLKMEVNFNRLPLQEAFDAIAEGAHVKIDIDGDALKFAGYTKNMPQTFTLGEVPAEAAIQRILQQYDKMVIVVDEQAKKVTVMTKDFAKDQGLKPYEFM